jgi:hypothetical protein
MKALDYWYTYFDSFLIQTLLRAFNDGGPAVARANVKWLQHNAIANTFGRSSKSRRRAKLTPTSQIRRGNVSMVIDHC